MDGFYHICNSWFSLIRNLLVTMGMIQFKPNHNISVLKRDSIPNSKLYKHWGQQFKCDSFRAMANWSSFDSIQFIHEMPEIQCKMLQIHPFAYLPHLRQTYALSKSVPKRSVIWCCWQLALLRVEYIFNEINKKESLTCVIVLPLPLRRQLKIFLY